jgi:TolB-like protein
MSGDPEQEYFADGMVEDIITALSRARWLFVIARNSSFTYKGKVVDTKQVGHELGVRYVLEGSVRKAGARLRITGQLIDAISIAVLPFQNMSGDPEQEYFADGMVEDIITALSRARWLFVIARNSITWATRCPGILDSEVTGLIRLG